MNGEEEHKIKEQAFEKAQSTYKLKSKDIENIMRLILQKQSITWYPEILKTSGDKETAEFIKQHFTEQGNELYGFDRHEVSSPLADGKGTFVSLYAKEGWEIWQP